MERILVTGACGSVGSAAVEELVSLDWQVIASDLDTRANEKAAQQYTDGDLVAVRWCDLTDPDDVTDLIETTAPDVVIHLAAVIPPACYAAPDVAHRVNVEGTRHLVAACERREAPPRVVLASSMAVHGSRNPHAGLGLLTPDTPIEPSDNYGQHKAAAEQIVHAADLDGVVLRLAGVLGSAMSPAGSGDALHFSALLPRDGNIHTVDVRDVARAVAAAAHGDVVGRTLLIGGDESHRRKQADIDELLTAMGLEDALPEGRPGNPADDAGWFATDWMDTTASQAALDFQRISWSDLLEDTRDRAGLKRHLLRLVAPVMHAVLSRRDPYEAVPGEYADVWTGVRQRWGDEALGGTPAE